MLDLTDHSFIGADMNAVLDINLDQSSSTAFREQELATAALRYIRYIYIYVRYMAVSQSLIKRLYFLLIQT